MFLLFVHSVSGQGTRTLIDLPTTQPSSVPQPGPFQPGSVPQPGPFQPGSVPQPGPFQPGSVPQPGPFQPGSVPRPGSAMPGQGLSPAQPSGGMTPAPVPSSPFGISEGRTPFPSNPVVVNDEIRRLWQQSSTTNGSSPPTAPSNTPAVSARQMIERITSVFEDGTEDEQDERELLSRRQRAEQIADPEQRERELDQLTRSETALRNRLQRRQVDEVGADLFYVPRLKEQFLREGWCQLFDGHTNTGWKTQTEGPYAGGKFAFGQNEIASDPRYPGLIYTTMPFGDATVRFDFCAEKNSEIFLLLKTPPDPADLNSSCYTFVLNSMKSNRPRGMLLGRHSLSLAELRAMRERLDNPSAVTNEEVWYTVTVKSEGSECQFWMDGRSPMTYFIPTPLHSGHIAFLVAEGKVRFQNILWRPNNAVAIFDKEDKTEIPWRVSQGAEFIENARDIGFSLTRGSVESKAFYDNFVLQMGYRQGMISGQSSLFVRPIPGQENTGYEISLQNFPRRRDRETIAGVDAGSFRQIQNARYVRAQDQQWTYLTVLAAGRQLQTWVNGVPVCEIRDPRKGRENALRKDIRYDPFLQPGPIRFSVPEDNTLFEFRDLNVSPILMEP